MSETNLQQEILDSLQDLKVSHAEVAAELKGIVARLDKVNGSVGRHEDKLGLLQLELANRAAIVKAALTDDHTVHRMNCPRRVRVEALEAFVIGYHGHELQNADSIRSFIPGILMKDVKNQDYGVRRELRYAR